MSQTSKTTKVRKTLVSLGLLAVVPLVLVACERRDVATANRADDPVVLAGSQVADLQGIAPSRLVAFSFLYGTWQSGPGTGRRACGAPHRAAEEPEQSADCALLHRRQHVDRRRPGRDVRRQRRDRGDVARPVRRGALDRRRRAERALHPRRARPCRRRERCAGEGGRSARRRLGLVGLPVRERRHARSGRRPCRRSSTTTSCCSPATTRRRTRSGSGANPENSSVTTSRYSAHFSDRWINDELRVTAGGATNVDILDRHKSGFAGSCARTEGTFSTGGGGVHRQQVGAGAGDPFVPRREQRHVHATRRDHVRGPHGRHDRTCACTRSRRCATGWTTAPTRSGCSTSRARTPAGVTIDGVPDSIAGRPAHVGDGARCCRARSCTRTPRRATSPASPANVVPVLQSTTAHRPRRSAPATRSSTARAVRP